MIPGKRTVLNDRGDLSRLESRISILGEEIGQLRSNVAYGLSAGEFSNDTVDSDEAGHESDDDEKRGAATDMGTGRPNDDQPAIIPTSTASWAAVRVFTKLQDKSSSAALSRRLALNVQDVKRLSKSVGELEEDMDTIRYDPRTRYCLWMNVYEGMSHLGD
uniref:Uncharacterized protein n=1 Tax=Spongospora subterranea TaxID=70186 RepID=A0A0H5QNK9_9EUKA|eukprot:CRZ02979.1 hypothetical protein [Spongospora subterranea]